MRVLTPVQVLSVLITRIERRADALEGVRMPGYDMTIQELRRFALMMRKAREHLQSQQKAK